MYGAALALFGLRGNTSGAAPPPPGDEVQSEAGETIVDEAGETVDFE